MVNQQLKHIGQLTGRLLVFGGVYSNLPALDAMRAIAQKEGFAPQNIICTGDVVAYCAEPEACVQQIKSWGIHCIAGNVELQIREGADDCGCDFDSGGRCDLFSQQWYPYAQRQLSPSAVEWMWSLPHQLSFEYAGLRGRVLHGSVTEVAGYIFASTPWAVKTQNLAEASADLVLAGHCGLPFASVHDDKYWLNAGVIGMPANDATTRVWYMILDTDEQGQFHYQHYPLTYDNALAAARMRAEKLPLAYAKTLETGLWDNCDILPETETNQQGERLVNV